MNKKKMDQATRAFHERDEYYKDPKLYDSLFTLNIQSQLKGYIINLRQLLES